MTMEYVSPSNARKDYEANFLKYEQELKVPYYLLFYPERQDLRLYRHTGYGYELVSCNDAGRLAIPELGTEVGLLDGWLRYWYKGELIPLPGDLQAQLDDMREEVKRLLRQAQLAERRARRAMRHVEQEKQRAEQEKQRAEQEKQRAEQERRQRRAAEAENTRLRALVEKLQGRKRRERPG